MAQQPRNSGLTVIRPEVSAQEAYVGPVADNYQGWSTALGKAGEAASKALETHAISNQQRVGAVDAANILAGAPQVPTMMDPTEEQMGGREGQIRFDRRVAEAREKRNAYIKEKSAEMSKAGSTFLRPGALAYNGIVGKTLANGLATQARAELNTKIQQIQLDTTLRPEEMLRALNNEASKIVGSYMQDISDLDPDTAGYLASSLSEEVNKATDRMNAVALATEFSALKGDFERNARDLQVDITNSMREAYLTMDVGESITKLKEHQAHLRSTYVEAFRLYGEDKAEKMFAAAHDNAAMQWVYGEMNRRDKYVRMSKAPGDAADHMARAVHTRLLAIVNDEIGNELGEPVGNLFIDDRFIDQVKAAVGSTSGKSHTPRLLFAAASHDPVIVETEEGNVVHFRNHLIDTIEATGVLRDAQGNPLIGKTFKKAMDVFNAVAPYIKDENVKQSYRHMATAWDDALLPVMNKLANGKRIDQFKTKDGETIGFNTLLGRVRAEVDAEKGSEAIKLLDQLGKWHQRLASGRGIDAISEPLPGGMHLTGNPTPGEFVEMSAAQQANVLKQSRKAAEASRPGMRGIGFIASDYSAVMADKILKQSGNPLDALSQFHGTANAAFPSSGIYLWADMYAGTGINGGLDEEKSDRVRRIASAGYVRHMESIGDGEYIEDSNSIAAVLLRGHPDEEFIDSDGTYIVPLQSINTIKEYTKALPPIFGSALVKDLSMAHRSVYYGQSDYKGRNGKEAAAELLSDAAERFKPSVTTTGKGYQLPFIRTGDKEVDEALLFTSSRLLQYMEKNWGAKGFAEQFRMDGVQLKTAVEAFSMLRLNVRADKGGVISPIIHGPHGSGDYTAEPVPMKGPEGKLFLIDARSLSRDVKSGKVKVDTVEWYDWFKNNRFDPWGEATATPTEPGDKIALTEDPKRGMDVKTNAPAQRAATEAETKYQEGTAFKEVDE
jgi:hypothetical protein